MKTYLIFQLREELPEVGLALRIRLSLNTSKLLKQDVFLEYLLRLGLYIS